MVNHHLLENDRLLEHLIEMIEDSAVEYADGIDFGYIRMDEFAIVRDLILERMNNN